MVYVGTMFPICSSRLYSMPKWPDHSNLFPSCHWMLDQMLEYLSICHLTNVIYGFLLKQRYPPTVMYMGTSSVVKTAHAQLRVSNS